MCGEIQNEYVVYLQDKFDELIPWLAEDLFDIIIFDKMSSNSLTVDQGNKDIVWCKYTDKEGCLSISALLDLMCERIVNNNRELSRHKVTLFGIEDFSKEEFLIQLERSLRYYFNHYGDPIPFIEPYVLNNKDRGEYDTGKYESFETEEEEETYYKLGEIVKDFMAVYNAKIVNRLFPGVITRYSDTLETKFYVERKLFENRYGRKQ